MKIKHYIVTYANNDMLKKCIESILATQTTHERSITVIANHSHDAFEGDDHVKILRNDTRPDFSTGHLSRNWNQALIHGFVNLNAPDADLVIACQNDCEFSPDYLDKLIEMHKTYDLITFGDGDNCVSYTPRAVKQVGLWDERFCNIGYQEADYFLRAAKYLREKASINDPMHGRIYNSLPNIHTIINHTTRGFSRNDAHHHASLKHHEQSYAVFQAKWATDRPDWREGFLDIEQTLQNFIYYPYFEMAIETLEQQKYLVRR